MTMADAERVPENAIAVPPPNATRYSPFRTSPSAIVIMTGPRPIPVRANETLRGPISWAALFMGNVSAVSVHPANATVTANSSTSHDGWTMRSLGVMWDPPVAVTRLAALGLGRDAHRANPGRLKMTRLIAAAAFIIAAAAPALACEWNKSAGADSQSTVSSQSGGAQHSKPVQRSRS